MNIQDLPVYCRSESDATRLRKRDFNATTKKPRNLHWTYWRGSIFIAHNNKRCRVSWRGGNYRVTVWNEFEKLIVDLSAPVLFMALDESANRIGFKWPIK